MVGRELKSRLEYEYLESVHINHCLSSKSFNVPSKNQNHKLMTYYSDIRRWGQFIKICKIVLKIEEQ